jgi:hypothetical protein
MLHLFPKVESMYVHRTRLSVDNSQHVITLLSVKTIDLLITGRYDGMAYMTFPNLVSLRYCSGDVLLSRYRRYIWPPGQHPPWYGHSDGNVLGNLGHHSSVV